MTMRYRFCALLAVVGVAAVAPLLAHHSVQGNFAIEELVVVRGVISKIQWTNPHIYIFLDVTDENGEVTQWAIETLPTNHLRRAGVTRESLTANAKGGDVVTVYAYPAHDKTKNFVFLVRIKYPDNHYIHIFGDPADFVDPDEASIG